MVALKACDYSKGPFAPQRRANLRETATYNTLKGLARIPSSYHNGPRDQGPGTTMVPLLGPTWSTHSGLLGPTCLGPHGLLGPTWSTHSAATQAGPVAHPWTLAHVSCVAHFCGTGSTACLVNKQDWTLLFVHSHDVGMSAWHGPHMVCVWPRQHDMWQHFLGCATCPSLDH